MTKEKSENKIVDNEIKGENHDLKSDELGKILHTKQEIFDSIKFIPEKLRYNAVFGPKILSIIKNSKSDMSCLGNSMFIDARGNSDERYNDPFSGLETVKNVCINNPDQVVVVCSIFRKDQLYRVLSSDNLDKYLWLLDKNNVFFADMLDPYDLEQQIEQYNNKVPKEENVNSETYFREMIEGEISLFLHDSLHDKKLRELTKDLNNCAKLKYIFSHEGELNQSLKDFISNILKLLEYQHPSFKGYSRDEKKQGILDIYEYEMTKELPEGIHYEGVFIDWDGCLYDNYKGEFNESVLKLIKSYEEKGLQIHIWTGGNLEKKQKILDDAHIKYKIESKTNYKGATVDIIIDNNSEDIVYANARVKAKEYIKI